MEAMQERLREQGEMTAKRGGHGRPYGTTKGTARKAEKCAVTTSARQARNEFSKQEERILDKQEQLQKLLDNIMSEEMRQIYKQMEGS